MTILNNLAFILILVIIFFIFLTQRILITNQHSSITDEYNKFSNFMGLRNKTKLVVLLRDNLQNITPSTSMDSEMQVISKNMRNKINISSISAVKIPNMTLGLGDNLEMQTKNGTLISDFNTNEIILKQKRKRKQKQKQPDLLTDQSTNKINSDSQIQIKKVAKKPPKVAPSFDVTKYHPYHSPREGTDISSHNQLSLLKCKNQSVCIIPELQLKIKLKIYLCKHPVRQGIRFYYLTREGFLLHPNVQLVDENDITNADFIVYLPGSAPWHRTECTNASYAKKLIVMDEFDGHTTFYPYETIEEAIAVYGKSVRWYFIYFKRSFVARLDGKFLRYPHIDSYDMYPLTYSVAEAYIPYQFNHVREIEILCTLRGSAKMTTRQRVQDWIGEYARVNNISNVIAGQVNTLSRAQVSKAYFQHMYNAKIIVTVNPANWEGDFRLWEAMASGALVMVDPIFVPHPHPLLDGKHVIFFSNTNKTSLWEKLDYYIKNPREARQIAIQGYLHAMKYHRTVSMIDYVLRSAHMKRAAIKNTKPFPKYTYTGQYLNVITRRNSVSIKELDRPALFESRSMFNHTHIDE